MTRWQLRIAALVMLGGGAALAQVAAPEALTGSAAPAAAAAATARAPAVPEAAPARGAAALSTEALRRAQVEDAGGVSLGSITDFVLLPDGSGKISHVVLALGGVMGVGRHAVAVPFSELQISPSKEGALSIRLPWTEAQLRSVPAYDPANPATLGLSGPAPVPSVEAP
ncbi:PRC-barrel domain-containing protein [Frigidibacter sp.]|uniref:PRC-barrel domain-containing protein n=1 Tax=Frigidibacter sp. TaxID=2586418 RepID=UPI002734D509|nr:PRC-barrel domain-containing protein [Frigidibacter sp.]MDP3340182.1 PRC-barrel domain-containing protein [Frigidibacter sp.]